jgi:hypothetical protein
MPVIRHEVPRFSRTGRPDTSRLVREKLPPTRARSQQAVNRLIALRDDDSMIANRITRID